MTTYIKYETKVDDDGNFIIPDEILQALGWKEGDQIEIDEVDGAITMKKVEESE